MPTSPNFIILGHSGFIGSHLEALISQSSAWRVVGRSLPTLDLTDERQAALLIPFLTPDSILVVAAALKRQFGDTLQAFHQNLMIVENLCRLLERHPVRKVVFLSSVAVYGEETENLNIHEQTPVNPTSYYGIAKFTGECLLRKACATPQPIPLLCLRPPLIYGPGDPGRTYGPSGFAAAAQEGLPIVLWGDGSELREFMFVEDLCRFIAFAADSDLQGEFNLVSGSPHGFADIVTLLKARFPNLQVEARPRSRAKANNVFDPTKLRSVLPPGFRFTALEDGLNRLLQPV